MDVYPVVNKSKLAESEDSMLFKYKPSRGPGESVSTLPTYTIPEAATYLAIDPWTLHSWYAEPDPILIPSAWYKEHARIALLSFRDVEEAYKLHLLRTKYSYSMQYLKEALVDARKESKSKHPLIDKKFIVFKYLAMDKPARGKQGRRVIPLGGQTSLYIPEVLDVWGKRIISKKQIFPWRYAKEDDKTRPVSLDPEVLSGRLVITGTRIPVRVLSARIDKGDRVDRIADDYGISPEVIKQALVHFCQKTT